MNIPWPSSVSSVLSVVMLFLVGPVRAEPVWLTDLDKALEVAAQEKKHVFLDYYAAWCPPCQELDQKVLRAGLLKRWESDFVFVHLDGDDLPRTPAQKRYPITGYPTVWILDPQGKALGRFVGFEQPKEFLEFMDEALSARGWTARLDARVAASPDSPEVLGEAFSGALAAQDPKKAEALKRKIREKRDEWDGSYERALIDECSTALYGEPPNYAGAVRTADAFLAEHPKSFFAPSAVHMKARALRSQGKAEAADALVASLTEAYPDSASAFWRVLEYARLNSVLRSQAEQTLEAGLKKFPEDERFLNQAVLFLREKDAARAGAIAQTLKKLKPQNAYYDDLIRSLSDGGKRGG